tara:strand:+ start:825 stop:1526 length:702 start_codon:yes stop_codon:yes gene_type:complete
MKDNGNYSVYVIIETPDSGGFEFLLNGLSDSNEENFHFLLPGSLQNKINPELKKHCSFWLDINTSELSINLNKYKEKPDLFLFFSPFLNLNDQFECLLDQIEKVSVIQISRVISFVNANIMTELSPNLLLWLDAVAHFSDVLCFSYRTNENGKAVKKIIDRYENMRYPLETYLISHTKKRKILNILNPTARRISHIFDSPDLLDNEETPFNDPYLKKLVTGKREKVIPIPFSQ